MGEVGRGLRFSSVELQCSGRSYTGAEVWRCGGVEVWRCGGAEVWRCGSVEVRRFSSPACMQAATAWARTVWRCGGGWLGRTGALQLLRDVTAVELPLQLGGVGLDAADVPRARRLKRRRECAQRGAEGGEHGPRAPRALLARLAGAGVAVGEERGDERRLGVEHESAQVLRRVGGRGSRVRVGVKGGAEAGSRSGRGRRRGPGSCRGRSRGQSGGGVGRRWGGVWGGWGKLPAAAPAGPCRARPPRCR